MKIQLHNTLSGEKEVFEPVMAGKVGMYNCGPTVYDRVHIGNLRAYVFSDTLRRTLEYAGYAVHQVMNITDVGHLSSNADQGEDKMTKALKREGKPLALEAMKEVGTKYSNAFVEDLKALNIEMPHEFPRASDHITEDIDLVAELDRKGFIYHTSDGMYFDTAKFPSYGRLGNIDISALKEGARIAATGEKRNPADFAVWKFDASLGWDSPWGKGFPGWHLECSAMSRKYLGQPFDIHTGGIDHIPVHHNNEIAQSEAAYDAPLAHYWMHNAFLVINDGRMGKSEGNAISLGTLSEKSIPALAYRYWLLTAHYRSPVNFSLEALEGAKKALIRLISAVNGYPEGGKVIPSYKERFEAYIGDDLDIPQALALLWELVKDNTQTAADKRATILDFDRVFGLNVEAVETNKRDIPAEITALAEEREKARRDKDWKRADSLREEIEKRGFKISDADGGFMIY